MISEFEIKIKYISKQIDNIDKSILDHSALINNLDRDIYKFADIHFNYQSNPNLESITSPVTGSHTGESSRSRSAEAQPTGVSLSNRRQPCFTPSAKIRPSLSASETRNDVVCASCCWRPNYSKLNSCFGGQQYEAHQAGGPK